jgi:DNA-binding MarR family transcriptional regulator
MTETLDSLDVAALAEALRPALLRVSRRLRQEAQKAGLSAQDALLLGFIRKNPGIGVSALAKAERTSKPTMSAHVKRLEADGFVRRYVDADDARRWGLEITPEGERKLAAVRRDRNDWLAARLARLSTDDRESLAAASDALMRLARP